MNNYPTVKAVCSMWKDGVLIFMGYLWSWHKVRIRRGIKIVHWKKLSVITSPYNSRTLFDFVNVENDLTLSSREIIVGIEFSFRKSSCFSVIFIIKSCKNFHGLEFATEIEILLSLSSDRQNDAPVLLKRNTMYRRCRRLLAVADKISKSNTSQLSRFSRVHVRVTI